MSKSFTEFDFSALNLDEQTFEDYKSKYLDIHDRTRSQNDEESESVIDEVDFELELIQRDDINVAYILKLLAKLQQAAKDKCPAEEYQQQKAELLHELDKEVQLRNKKDIIEKFIDTRIAKIEPEAKIESVFRDFWDREREAAIERLCELEKLDRIAIERMIADYKFSGKEPLRETVLSACKQKPKLLERKKIFKRVVSGLLEIIDKFDDTLGEFEE